MPSKSHFRSSLFLEHDNMLLQPPKNPIPLRDTDNLATRYDIFFYKLVSTNRLTQKLDSVRLDHCRDVEPNLHRNTKHVIWSL